MISTILATIAFLIIVEGLLVALMPKNLKKALYDLSKKKDANKIIFRIGLWEILIGMIALCIAIFLRNA
jgi:uncharacterized protein YjeT (DUF2065 family)